MSYLGEFGKKIHAEDHAGVIALWEEYCAGDDVDGVELKRILELIAEGHFAQAFGRMAETALPLIDKVADEELKYQLLMLLLDLEVGEPPTLGDRAYEALEKRYSDQPGFQEKIRLVGLRNRIAFRGAIRHFELLNHLAEGRFVYHTAGWGTGEILEVSPVREELSLEFEDVPGRRVLSFENAFRHLSPLPDTHFLARRFGDPDLLEEEARKDPVAVVQILLSDLGPKTAAEIKDELCELVIPEADWARWWQSARGRLKRDTRIDTPRSVRDPFRLHEEAVSHVDRMKQALTQAIDPDQILVTAYSFVRDFSEVSRSAEGRDVVQGAMTELLEHKTSTPAQRLQVYALIEDLGVNDAGASFADAVGQVDDLAPVINSMEIIAYKKRVLVALRKGRSDWPTLFVTFLEALHQSALRDYLLKELMTQPEQEGLKQLLESLLDKPAKQAHLFVWYFQKVMRKDADVLFKDKAGQCRFFEAFLVLFHQLEQEPSDRELVKKMYNLLTAGRYALVRDVLAESPLAFTEEFLLLVSKLHSLTQHDGKIMRALAEVAHPSLADSSRKEKEADFASTIIWTTEAGYKKLHARVEEIGEKEMIDNSREIAAAAEHGDLRENAEFKAAKERQARLQAELKLLSDQLKDARILTAGDVTTDTVGVGTIVSLRDGDGNAKEYTLLGPWDADPNRSILAFQSRFAQAMAGLKAGEDFTYQDRTYTVQDINSYFDHA